METKVVVSSKREIAAIEALTILQFHIASCVSRKEMFTVGKIFQPTPGLKKRSSTLDKLHSYPFIPLRPDIILSELIFAIELLTGKFGRDSWTKAPKFLDAGCGPGNIMLLAGACGFNPYGIELDTEAIEHAKHFNPYYRNISRRNILTYKDYGKFDVVYYYCPINGPKQTNFEELVEDTMKVGAILLPHLKKSRRIIDDERFKRLEKTPSTIPLYMKVAE